jgi:hypothetical protein
MKPLRSKTHLGCDVERGSLAQIQAVSEAGRYGMGELIRASVSEWIRRWEARVKKSDKTLWRLYRKIYAEKKRELEGRGKNVVA